jgi:hypothetical protein
MGKKGYFFTLDAFLAVGILAVGLVILYLSQSFTPSTAQSEFLAQDLLKTLGSTKLSELNSRYVDEQRFAGNITSMSNTLLEQMGEFYYTNQIGNAQNFSTNITSAMVPPAYGYRISMDTALLTNRSVLSNDNPDLSVSKSFVLGVINTSVLWGPYPVEVLIWR